MGSAKLKLLVAAGMSLALFGTATVGLYHADGQEKAKASTDAKRPAEAKPDQPTTPQAAKPAGTAADYVVPQPKTSADARAILAKPLRIRGIGAMTLDALIQQLNAVYASTGVQINIDYAAYRRLTPPDLVTPHNFGESKLPPISVAGISTLEALTQILAFLPAPSAIQVRGDQLWIVPAYTPYVVTNSDQSIRMEYFQGPPVYLKADDIPLEEVLNDLRKQTGANIVLDWSRYSKKTTAKISITLNDVRLRTALTVLADTCELKLVKLNNVYYLTTPQNAELLQKEIISGPFVDEAQLK